MLGAGETSCGGSDCLMPNDISSRLFGQTADNPWGMKNTRELDPFIQNYLSSCDDTPVSDSQENVGAYASRFTRAMISFDSKLQKIGLSLRGSRASSSALAATFGQYLKNPANCPEGSAVANMLKATASAEGATQTIPALEPSATVQNIPTDRLKVTSHGAIIFRGEKGNIVFRPTTSSTKDLFPEGKTRLFVIPTAPLQNFETGVADAEGEGSTFFGFFVAAQMKEPIPYAIDESVAPYFYEVLATSYGTRRKWTNDDVAKSYPKGAATPGFPDLEGETAHWMTIPLEKMQAMHTFKNGVLVFDDIVIHDRGNGEYVVFEKGVLIGRLNLNDYPVPLPRLEKRTLSDYEKEVRWRILVNGEPGVVPIHSGSLFSKEETSGHVKFNNGRAMVVDPPIDAAEWFDANRIPMHLIDEIHISHIHVDHAGGFVRFLNRVGHRVTLVADPIVEQQLVDVLVAQSLGNVSAETFRKMWDFRPIRFKEAWQAKNGLWHVYRHGNHSVPPTGHTVYSDKPNALGARPVFSYSGDTNLRPDVNLPLLSKIDPKTERPVISGYERFADIVEAPWEALQHGGIAAVDAGVPPLHNTLPVVAQLASARLAFAPAGAEVRAYHEDEAKIKAAGLETFGGGLADAVLLRDRMNWKQPADYTRTTILHALKKVPIFKDLQATDFEEILKAGELQTFATGSKIIGEGDKGDAMYVMVLGEVNIVRHDDGRIPVLTRDSGLFGETAVVGENRRRNASIYAAEKTSVFKLPYDKVQDLLANRGVIPFIADLGIRRTQAPVVNEVFSPNTADAVLISGETRHYAPKEVIIREGETSDDIYMIVDDGEVKVKTSNRSPTTPFDLWRPIKGSGSIFGEMARITGEPRSATVIAGDKGVTVLKVEGGENLTRLIADYPEVGFKLAAFTTIRKADGNKGGGKGNGGGNPTSGGGLPRIPSGDLTPAQPPGGVSAQSVSADWTLMTQPDLATTNTTFETSCGASNCTTPAAIRRAREAAERNTRHPKGKHRTTTAIPAAARMPVMWR